MDKDEGFPRWDPHDPHKSLTRLYGWTVENAQEQINWYARKSRPKRRFSQFLLVLAVLLGGFGILCPLIDNACRGCVVQILGCSASFLHLGYIFIALAGIVVLFDRSFGFSAGWMRFIETQMKLEQLLKEFRFEWTKAVARRVPEEQQEEQQQELLSKLLYFTNIVEALVIDETRAWILDFRKNLSEIDKMVDKGGKQ